MLRRQVNILSEKCFYKDFPEKCYMLGQRQVSALYFIMKQSGFTDRPSYDIFNSQGEKLYRMVHEPLQYGRYITIYDGKTEVEIAVLKDVSSRVFEVEMGLFVADEKFLGVKELRVGYLVSVPLVVVGREWYIETDGRIVDAEGRNLFQVQYKNGETHFLVDNDLLEPIEIVAVGLAKKLLEEQRVK